MKKNMKLLLIPCTAAALTLGSAMISFAATGWAEENGQWVYYNNDGSKATDVFKKATAGFTWTRTATWRRAGSWRWTTTTTM